MKLLQIEVDANPAASPTMQPNVDGRIQMNAGVAVLDLNNSSESENNFWIWVRAARPEDAWLEKHCRIEALGPVHGVQDNLENGKYKAYVRQRDARRLSIKVDPPMQPESRAGVYDMVATVQSQVPLRVGNEEQSVFEFAFKVAVRPYHQWTLTVEPAETPVRIFRRKAIVWATVENTGNDWLYIDLKLPKESGQLSYERDAERIAVPPAASSKSPTTRRIPIRVRSKYRNIRGTAIKVPVPLTASRVDAPTVARFPSTADIVVPSLNLSSPVLVEPTTDNKTVSGADVAYYPPIPATFTDFVTSVRTNLMALLTLFLMGLAAFYAATFMYENIAHKYEYNKTTATPETVAPGGTVVVRGPKLDGSDVEVKAGDKILKSNAKIVSGDIQVTILKDPSIVPGTEATIFIKRRGLGFLTWPPIFPAMPVTVKIGQGALKVEALDIQAPAKTSIGANITIEHAGTVGFGAKKGTVKLDVTPLSVVSWTEDRIVAAVPNDPNLASDGVTVSVKRADGTAEGRKSIAVVDPNALPATTAGAPVDPNLPPADGGAPPGGGPPPTDSDPSGAGSSGGAPPSGSTGGGSTGGSTGGAGTTGGGGGSAYQPTPAYTDMLQAVKDGDRDALLIAAQAAESAKEPGWKSLKMYAYAVAGKRDTVQELKRQLDTSPPAPRDRVGNALLLMAEAEAAEASGNAKKAKAGYVALSVYLQQYSLDLELPKAALDRYGKGW